MTTFASDAFGGSGNLAGRTPDVGGTWTRSSNSGNTLSPTVGSGVMTQGESNSTQNYYYVDTAPTTGADYSVSAVFNWTSTDTGFQNIGVIGRLTTTCYGFGYGRGDVGFVIWLLPSYSAVGTILTATALATGSYELTLEMVGTTIRGKVKRMSDGYFLESSSPASFAEPEVWCKTVTSGDYSSAGKAGIFFQSGGSPGAVFDSFEAYDTGGSTGGGGGSSAGAARNYYSQLSS